MDDLSYSYNYSGHGNQLRSLSDSGGSGDGWDAEGGSFTYDAVGNVTKAPGPYEITDATYDERNLPVRITSGGSAVTYRYDLGGQRIFEAGNGQTRHFARGTGGAVVGVFAGGGALRHWNVVGPGSEVLGKELSGGGRRYYYKDRLGSVHVVVDEYGSVKEAYGTSAGCGSCWLAGCDSARRRRGYVRKRGATPKGCFQAAVVASGALHQKFYRGIRQTPWDGCQVGRSRRWRYRWWDHGDEAGAEGQLPRRSWHRRWYRWGHRRWSCRCRIPG